MGFFNTLVKAAPVIIKGIELIGDMMDDGKKNYSYKYQRNNYNDYEDYDD